MTRYLATKSDLILSTYKKSADQLWAEPLLNVLTPSKTVQALYNNWKSWYDKILKKFY